VSRQQPQSGKALVPGCSLDEDSRLQYLEAMGIQPWFEKYPAADIPPVAAEEAAQPAIIDDPMADAPPSETVPAVPTPGETRPQPLQPLKVADMDWQQLEQAVSQCQLCELHSSRTRTVFGVGNHNADLLVIGEAPGADEDRQGEPFVGRAGQLLDAMLAAIQLDRRQVFIANVLKCRPPDNRNPHTSEIVCCDAYLQRQIELIQPKMILALGRIAAHHLLVSQESLGKLRQQVHSYHGIPLVVSYHPAYLLRKPADKGKSWQDLLKIKKRLQAS
jgi:DNA polymerase